MLGNLSVKEIESRAGVELPADLIDYMEPRRQQKANGVKAGEWHCFDMPFTLVCGDDEVAQEIYKHLGPLSSEFDNPMQIAVSA